MELEENLYVIKLFGFYGNLLSENQNEIMKEFLEADLTISEVAENHGITRQAVLDVVKKSKEKLFDYEKKLKFLHNQDVLIDRLDELQASMERQDIKQANNKLQKIKEGVKIGTIF